MDIRKLENLLKEVKTGKASIEKALAQLKSLPFEDLGFTRIDHHREPPERLPGGDLGRGEIVRPDPFHCETA